MKNLLYFKVTYMATVRNFEVIFYSCEAYIDPTTGNCTIMPPIGMVNRLLLPLYICENI